MKAAIAAIEYYLPEKVLSNGDLASQFPDWSIEKIEQKTGIADRHIAAEDECASDMAFAAAKKLFASGAARPEEIEYLLLCTQSPDYFLPTTACILQERLGIPTSAGAMDFNLGCSGYIFGLSLAKGLVETGQVRNVLLIMAETYSKHIHPADKSVRTIFGDAAAATLVRAVDTEEDQIGPFVFGTDGRGWKNLVVPTGGLRKPRTGRPAEVVADDQGNVRSEDHLYMNGPEIFAFTLSSVPDSVSALLSKASMTLDDIDVFVFHQANQFMLEHLRKKMKIPAEKFLVWMRGCGNTVSSTIPIALHEAQAAGTLKMGTKLMLVGFGVGYSWGATLVKWQ